MPKIVQSVFEMDHILPVAKGEKVSFNSLFSVDSRGKLLQLLGDILPGKELTLKVNKLEPMTVQAEAPRKKGDKTILSELIRYQDMLQEVKALEDIKRLESLTITIQTPSFFARLFGKKG